MSNPASSNPPAAPAKPVNMVRAIWREARLFESGRVGHPPVQIDGDSVAAPSPPDVLLSALATCTSIDVVDVLAKRHTPLTALELDVVGQRRAEHPRRFVAIDLTFHVTGGTVERVHAERAVALSLERYCTVAASLAADIVIQTVVVLNGERGEMVTAKVGR